MGDVMAFLNNKKNTCGRRKHSVHERWLQDEKYRTSQTELFRTEQSCDEIDELGNTNKSTKPRGRHDSDTAT